MADEEEGAGTRCPVCLDDMPADALIRLPCQHSFCSRCISAWLPNLRFAAGTCPICRVSLSLQTGERGGALAMGHDDPQHVFCAHYPRSVWRSVASMAEGVDSHTISDNLLRFLPNKEELEFFDEERFCLLVFSGRQFNPLQRRKSPRQTHSAETNKTPAEETVKAQLRYLSASESEHTSYVEILDENDALLLAAWVNAVTFIRSMLMRSSQGVTVKDRVGRVAVLRSLHDGMKVACFDVRGRIMTEVLHADVGQVR